MFPSPLHLALTLATYTFALPLCALSLTITHLLGLESNEERSLDNKIGVELVDNPGKPESSNANELRGSGSGARGMMERRFSSTNSALIPVPEEEHKHEQEEESSGDGGSFVTCEEESFVGNGNGAQAGGKRRLSPGEQLERDEEELEEESYSLTPRLLVDLFDQQQRDEGIGGIQLPPSPSLFSTIDPTLPSLLSEPMPFFSASDYPDPAGTSGFADSDSPATVASVSTASSSPEIATPGDASSSPATTTNHLGLQPQLQPQPRHRHRPSSPDPRQKTKKHPSSTTSSSRHSQSHTNPVLLAQNAAHHQQVIHGLPRHRPQQQQQQQGTGMEMGGGTFEGSKGTPLRGLGLLNGGFEGGEGGGGFGIQGRK